ncbi:MAG TPA: DUF494 family protein [Gammaproteobacteria bacterium]|nr:DUF494 family protein [Gammaproteobacteria bacterium]
MNDVLQVLMYFFDKIENDLPTTPDDHHLLSELKELGIPLERVHQVLAWMNDLIEPNGQIEEYPLQRSPIGTRVFSTVECVHLNRKCRGFLLTLEQIGVLSATTRELVMDQLLQINPENINIAKIKWVVLGILCKQPDKTAAACMERYLLSEEPHRLH